VNPYLKTELTEECVRYIAEHIDEVRTLFTELLDEQRLDDLLRLSHNTRASAFSTHAVLDLCGIEYRAPADAASTGLRPESIDYHTSILVFQHIPSDILTKIIDEGVRILKKDGLFVHRINYTDHFSHSDTSIPAVNFLQYSDDEWNKYAGNKYMYMNRLRHDDYVRLFRSAGLRVLVDEHDVDEHVRALLESGRQKLDERFKYTPIDVLSIISSWLVCEKGK
jgi:hypothetical protein